MEIVERNMVGKKSQEACEDGIVVTDDFIAVIDGSTSKTPTHLSPDMKNGRFAMVLISEFIKKELKAEASVDDFCQGVSSYIYVDQVLKWCLIRSPYVKYVYILLAMYYVRCVLFIDFACDNF